MVSSTVTHLPITVPILKSSFHLWLNGITLLIWHIRIVFYALSSISFSLHSLFMLITNFSLLWPEPLRLLVLTFNPYSFHSLFTPCFHCSVGYASMLAMITLCYLGICLRNRDCKFLEDMEHAFSNLYL